MSVFAPLLLLAAFACFASRRLLQYLHIFQQEEYAPRCFLLWIAKTRAFDKRVSAALLALSLVTVWSGAPPPAWGNEILVAAAFVLFAFFENDPRKVAKKKLIMTDRARRIFGVAFILCLTAGGAALCTRSTLSWILAVQFAPFSLALANVLLMPLEARIQRKIMKEASEKLALIDPTVIGITGSFGKTSVKHILGHILELNAPTLFTPGSVNTLMGVSRVIREELSADIRYFLVEMGAYGQGSIEKLCRLTPPQIGIITALGEAHYERFKTLDTAARAKFELAEAVLSQELGKTVVHEDVLAQEYARAFVERYPGRFLICGRGPHADLKIGEIEQTPAGLIVPVQWQGRDFALFAPLYGAAHADNIALAFATALICGITPERAVTALRTVPQIKHRLEVKTQPDGMIYIDDAYNSNPNGFKAALDLLAKMAAEKGRRRILITPGIVELGDKNEEIHKTLGMKAAQDADVVFVVRSDKIPSFAEGFRMRAPQKQIYLVANFKEALDWLTKNAKASDAVLIENDLPDVDEAKLVL